MGQRSSSLKVEAHLEMVGQCGCPDRLTMCMPRDKKKGRRRLLAAFRFPGTGDGAGQHKAARKSGIHVAKLSRKEGATPVRMDFLAGKSLVARREIPLADLLAALQEHTEGRRSALFFSLEGSKAEDAGGAQDGAIAVSFNRKILKETQPPGEEPLQSQYQASAEASLPPQAG